MTVYRVASAVTLLSNLPLLGWTVKHGSQHNSLYGVLT